MGESITTICHPAVTSLVTFDMKYPENIQCSISTHSLEGGTLTKFLKDMLVKMKAENRQKLEPQKNTIPESCCVNVTI